MKTVGTLLLFCLSLGCSVSAAESMALRMLGGEAVLARKANGDENLMLANRMLVILQPGVEKDRLSALCAEHGFQVSRALRGVEGGYLVSFPEFDSDTLTSALAAFRAESAVIAIAEPDQLVRPCAKTPDDPYFYGQWGLSRTGAPDYWDVNTGDASIIVAVLDDGVQLDHPDLAANIWVNSGEIPANGIDDDYNGYIDDYNGYDFYANDSDPSPFESGHGTGVAGIVGAVGDNSVGVSGAAWTTSLMVLRVIGPGGYGTVSAVVEAIAYSEEMGAHIDCGAWEIDEDSAILRAAIADLDAGGGLFVASAGNDGGDIDADPVYPAAYDLDNIISVGAMDDDNRWDNDSNHGVLSVDLAAPGENIATTSINSGYNRLDGTSAAAAMVAGACALVWSADETLTNDQVKADILDAVLKFSGWNELCVSGGALSLSRLADGYVNVTSQNSADGWGVVMLKGEAVTITWLSGGIGDTVDISLVGDEVIYEIVSATANDGSYDWTVAVDVPNGEYRIFVADGDVYDANDVPVFVSTAKVSVTMDSSPAAARLEDEPYTVDAPVGVALEIGAAERDGYAFNSFSSDPDANASFEDAASARTEVSFSGDTTVSANFTVDTALLSEDFSLEICPPTDWEQVTTNEGGAWTWTEISHDALPGSVVCGGDDYLDERLITPELALPAGGDPYSRFYWRADPDEKSVNPSVNLSVNIRTIEEGEASSWVEIWSFRDLDEWDSGEWIECVLDLTEYAGQTAQIAFVYACGNIESSLVYIDDVEVFPSGHQGVALPFSVTPLPRVGGLATDPDFVVPADGVILTAEPFEGFVFQEWRVNGNAFAESPYSASSEFSVFGAATVWAVFREGAAVVALTVSSQASANGEVYGHTVPGGTVPVEVNQSYSIFAEATADYAVFAGWKVKAGDVSLSSATSPSAKVIVYSGPAAVIAEFIRMPARLTVTGFPSTAGSTDPQGDLQTYVGEWETVSAAAAESHTFLGWEVEDAFMTSATDIWIDGERASAKAHFVNEFRLEGLIPAEWTAWSDNPGNPGWDVSADMAECDGDDVSTWLVSPEIDLTHLAYPALRFSCVYGAIGSGGLYLRVSEDGGASWSDAVWSLTPGGEPFLPMVSRQVLDFRDYAEKTVLIAFQCSSNYVSELVLSDLAVAGVSNAVELETVADPVGGGAIDPAGTTVVSAGVELDIAAEPADGYYFSRWVVDGRAEVGDYTLAETTAELAESATLTAEFAVRPTVFITKGSALEISAAQLGLTEFTAKPKVLATYTDPLKGVVKTVKLRVTTKVSAKDPATVVLAEWTKKIKLFNRKDYRGRRWSTALIDDPLEDLEIDSISVEVDKVPLDWPVRVFYANPQITEVSRSGDLMTLRGRWFGDKAPKVYVEHQNTNQDWRYRHCNVKRKWSYLFKNARDKVAKSCMKVLVDDSGVDVGYSTVTVKWPENFTNGIHNAQRVILDNGGAATADIYK